MNQPPHAEYPRPDGSRAGRGPGVYFEAIGEASRLVSQNLGDWIAATFVLFVLGYASSLPGGMIVSGMMVPPRDPAFFQRFLSLIPLQLALNVVPASIMSILLVGMVTMGVRKLRGEYINVGMIFEPFRRFGKLLLVNLLFTVVLTASICGCFVPFLFFGPVLMLMPTVAYLRNVGPVEALSETFDACRSHWSNLLALSIVLAGLNLLGVFACLIGLLFTIPVAVVTLSIHYQAFFDRHEPETAPAYDPSIFR